MKYLIRSRGLYWRENGEGYTPYLWDAGLYSEEKAEYQVKSRPKVDSAWPLSAYEKDIPEMIEQLEKGIKRLKEMQKELENEPD